MVYVIEGIVLLLFGVLLLKGVRPEIKVKNKKEVGVKRASMIYSDEKGSKMLIAESLGLHGKPDMVFQTWALRNYIPLEIKSGRLKEDEPHLGDLYQLGVYFLLIEEEYGKRPPYGKLVYANKTFKVRNTRKLRKQVLQTIEDMKSMLEGNVRIEAKPDYTKCRHCVCRETVCEWAGRR